MSGKYYFKVHKHPSEVVIAICDEEILGQTFKGEKMKITVNEGFYGGDLVTEEFVRINIGSFTILNIVGNRIIDLAIAEGIIDAENVIQIGDVKHAQAVRA
ncbi:MAG: DUF424 family protein [archaeon]|nr:DUF424 family protein [archaeon]